MEATRRRKAMWLYPKAMGFNPPERWGHSSCFYEGVLYVFGGCCGGLHFSDVLSLNLETMAWSSIVTTGQKPGTRDSHSSSLVGHNMIVLGGTNGSKKVNDVHVLDLRTKEWSMPTCKGTAPSPRESHTTTIFGNKLVIFGGSGEGEANYLNDVHILDLSSMTWTSPEVKGDIPAPRDSHCAVAVGNKLLIYGGDCGDRYHGEVDVLDVDAMTWSRLAVCGPSPGVRAGHAAVSIGSKVYIIGGVGDKQYYNDVWVLDVVTCKWIQLEICGQQPQGRFAHTALSTGTDVAIYGGCGEDERPLNELIILQLGLEHPNGRYNISMCKTFSSHWTQEKRKFLRSENMRGELRKRSSDVSSKSHERDLEQRTSLLCQFDSGISKRRIGETKVCDIGVIQQEEHSLSLSQHSSPSQSEHDQNGVHRLSDSPNGRTPASHSFVQLKRCQQKEPANGAHQTSKDVTNAHAESPRSCKAEQFLHAIPLVNHQMHFLSSEDMPQPRSTAAPLIGAEVHGIVDGAFDSGFLMTANVNGQIFRGILFAPGPSIVAPRFAVHPQILSSAAAHPQYRPNVAQAIPLNARPLPQAAGFVLPEHHPFTRPNKAVKAEKLKNDLHDVVLTLGGPGEGI